MNSTPDSWAPPRAMGIAFLVGGVVLGICAVASYDDPAGLVLIGLAALALLGYGLAALLLRPRLSVGDTLMIRTLGGHRRYPHSAVTRIRVIDYPRLGRRIPQLEFDLIDPATSDERLIILGRWDLGTDPREVADALRSHGFTVGETQR